MMKAQWELLRQQWQGNARLRTGGLIALVILSAHGLLALSDRSAEMHARFERDAELLQRLDDASREQDWLRRAKVAEAALGRLEKSIPAARTEGGAQADLQAWLMRQAVAARFAAPVVRVESVVDVPDRPDLWQVLARLDATGSELDLQPLMRAFAEGLPWLQLQRIEVTQAQPTRIGVIVRAYYRRAERAGDSVPLAATRVEQTWMEAQAATVDPPSSAAVAPEGGQ